MKFSFTGTDKIIECDCSFPFVFAFYDVDAEKLENFFTCNDFAVAERNFYSTLSGYPPMIANAYDLVFFDHGEFDSDGNPIATLIAKGSELKSYLSKKGFIKEKEVK